MRRRRFTTNDLNQRIEAVQSLAMELMCLLEPFISVCVHPRC